jgi:pimeloyl-ACP methyl ester carboxylesterase
MFIALGTVTCIWLSSCAGKNAMYTPELLADVRGRSNLTELTFTTKKGSQGAFYFGPKSLPKHVVMVFPGIGSRGLDRLDWVDQFAGKDVGILLIDYPARGVCEGVMRPSDLPLTTDGALGELEKVFTVDRTQLMSRLSVAGHSFGTGATLQFVSSTPVDRIVLLSPFTTMKKALFRKMGPIAWLIPDNLDSRKYLRKLYDLKPDAKVLIIHGALDETVPISMGRALLEISKGKAEFREIPDGDHVSVLTKQADMVFEFLLK